MSKYRALLNTGDTFSFEAPTDKDAIEYATEHAGNYADAEEDNTPRVISLQRK